MPGTDEKITFVLNAAIQSGSRRLFKYFGKLYDLNQGIYGDAVFR